jgi:leucyl-tRNA synthetase
MTDASPAATAATSDIPAFRYTGVLAGELEVRWQDRWEAEGTFAAPNPAGPLGASTDEERRVAALDPLFILDMFPYPSGSGLHVGHPLGYIGTDVYARYQRMAGRNVLYTMGYDAFGLPAEQYAVQTGTHPAQTTAANVETYRRQLRRLGLSHDARRSLATTDPAYYRWTQWIFLQIFDAWFDPEQGRARPIVELVAELSSGARPTPDGTPWEVLSATERRRVVDDHRLAYVAEAPVNWCPGLGTVVANEEVTAEGRSDRGNFPVFKRNMRQWMLRITAYADRLIDDLDLLEWSEAIKTMQRNWIGRSTGATVHFPSKAGPITVFTTRPDTLFGATFMVLAPEHPLVDALTTPDQAAAVAAYRSAAAATSEIARQDDSRAKTGVFTGSTAGNPVTAEEIPVWIADYVLIGYGTGAIMAVPSGDRRDFEFARQHDLAIVAVQQPPAEWFAARGIEPTPDTADWPEAFVGDAAYVNSQRPGLDLHAVGTVAEGVALTNAWLEANAAGHPTVNYKLRDWLFSRQRYWGEPFPVVFDDDGLPHPLPEDQLPVLLPDTDEFAPRTFDPDDEFSDPESPLDRLGWWNEVELDLGDGPRHYRRETNVMPQWAGSCWSELRYCDPTNEDSFVDPQVERYWMGPKYGPDSGGVDLYVGGVEHAVLHLLYARFWHKVLFDLGHVSSVEPYHRLFNQGYILAEAYKDERGVYVDSATVVDGPGGGPTHDGRPVTREWGKMGKSLKNAVGPDEIYEAYGADTLRLHEMSMGPLDASRPWETRDVVGMYRFLQRVWRNVIDEQSGEVAAVEAPASPATLRVLHRTIAGVADDMEHLRFNTAIAKLIELNNHLTKVGGCPREVAEPLVLMLAPLAPHVAEELWAGLGHDESLAREPFPIADPALLAEDTVEYPVQVNGKVRGRVVVPVDADAGAVEAAALAEARVVAALGGATPRKVIVVPGRMVNVVV